jgi:hypothetical protein
VRISETNEAIEVSSGRMRVRVQRQPMLVTVYDSQNRIVCEDDPARPVMYDTETGAFEDLEAARGDRALLRLRRKGAADVAP